MDSTAGSIGDSAAAVLIQPATNPGPAAYGGVVLLILPALLLRKHPQMLIWCLILWINVVVMVMETQRDRRSPVDLRYTLPAAAAAAMLAAARAKRFRGDFVM